MRNKKGISLIVLIITIIVMIIIAGAIIISLINSEVIDKASETVKEYNIAAEKEKILLSYNDYQLQKYTSANPQSFLTVMQDKLSDVATVAGSSNGPITITFNQSQNKYTVYENGNIVGPNTTTAPAELEEYILGTDRQGKNITEILGDDGFINAPFDIELIQASYNEENEIQGNVIYTYYIKYNSNEYYKFQINIDIVTEQGMTDTIFGVQHIDTLDASTNIGKQVTYANETWTILYDDKEHGVQMISNNSLTDSYGNRIYLGANNIDNSIESYNNAISTLNEACNNRIPAAPGIIKNIRSVGSNPINPTSENKTTFSSSKFSEITQKINGFDINALNNRFYVSDNNYIEDLDQLIITNLLTPANIANKEERPYWLASRGVFFGSSNYDQNNLDVFASVIRCVFLDYISIYTPVIAIGESKEIEASELDRYIRPVITLENDIINRLEGNGSASSPYDLDKYYESTIIVTETANTIPNGTYYNFGLNDQSTKLIISDTGNSFCYNGTCEDSIVTINNGNVTVAVTIFGSSYTFDGNYYETKQNKILTLGNGSFGTTDSLGDSSKNKRLGFLMAINDKDLKHDIVGTFKSKNNGNYTLTFSKNSIYANFSFTGHPNNGSYIYVGFKDMFYMNDSQIKYTGLDDGFGWNDPQSAGTYYRAQ